MDKDEQYILDELAYAVERDSWFEINGRSSSILQTMLKSKDAEIERLRTGNRLHLELAEIKEGEIERLREALGNILSVQPIKDNEGSADIISLAKALLEIDSIARVTLKEKE